MDLQPLIDMIVAQLREVESVSAVVLGGSRARGTHSATSDIDLGLYYHPDRAPDLRALERVAAGLDDQRRAGLVTALGGWGPWINGGGWLTVRAQPVDLLYRDLRQVGAVIDACHAGQVEIAYQPGHPHGFVSAIYLAEVAVCHVLWDADGQLERLKRRASPYPPALREGLVAKFMWEIGFTLGSARKGAGRADVAYVAGGCFRAAMCMLQVLFALNEQHWLNEKGALALADSLPLRPPRLRARVEEAFALLAADGAALSAALDTLDALRRDVEALAAEAGARRSAGSV